MKLHVNQEADALYLPLNDAKIVESEEISPGIVLDFNADSQIVGVEFLHYPGVPACGDRKVGVRDCAKRGGR